MSRRARRERRGEADCRSRLALAALIVLAPIPPVLAQPRAAQARADAAEAAVAKLRDLPLPLHAFSRGVPPSKTTPPPLPALEARRQHVYEDLHAIGAASVPALARALRDPDPDMRRDAAVALDVIGGGWWHFPDGGPKLDLRPALPALLAALRDSDPGVRSWAAQAISDMGPAAAAAVPRLRALLRSSDPESRGSACNALGNIGAGAREALPDLRHALDDSSPEVRQAAHDAIASIERPAAAQ